MENRKLTIIAAVWLVLAAAAAQAAGLAPLRPEAIPVPPQNVQTPEKIELGRKLFFDRRLSGDGTMSCSSCHEPEQAFTDGMDISLSYPSTKNWRNSPTLYDVAFQTYLFHDGRARTLEEQAIFPMMSAFEMNRNLDYMEEAIREVPEYVDAFQKVFGGEVTRGRVAMAIAAFERTIISANAPLDRYLVGDRKALSPEARKGYEVFIGKGKCVECHNGPILTDDRFYALNVPENPAYEKDPLIAITRRFVAKVYHYPEFRTLAEDPGRYLITKDKKDWKAFKTPTLREIALTGPYMHNGIFGTLEEVIDFFNRGGGPGNTVLKRLGLSADEKKALKVFLVEGLAGEHKPFVYPKVP